MILVSDRSRGELLGLRVQGRRAAQSPAQLAALIDTVAEDHQAQRCVMELVGFDALDVRPAREAAERARRRCPAVEQCAVVGLPEWRRRATDLFKTIFPRAEVRFFRADERERAWRWAEGARPAAGGRA